MSKILEIIFFGLIVVVGIVWWSNRSSKGTINYTKIEAKPTATNSHFQDNNLAFDFWPGYQVRKNGENNYTLIGPSGASDLWTIMLTKNASLGENSGVMMRRAKSDIYDEVPYQSGVIFTNKNESEKVYFGKTKSGLLSVAVTNFADSTEIEKKMEEMVGSIK